MVSKSISQRIALAGAVMLSGAAFAVPQTFILPLGGFDFLPSGNGSASADPTSFIINGDFAGDASTLESVSIELVYSIEGQVVLSGDARRFRNTLSATPTFDLLDQSQDPSIVQASASTPQPVALSSTPTAYDLISLGSGTAAFDFNAADYDLSALVGDFTVDVSQILLRNEFSFGRGSATFGGIVRDAAPGVPASPAINVSAEVTFTQFEGAVNVVPAPAGAMLMFAGIGALVARRKLKV